jgi:uncharacterized protein (DUF2141 family)
MGKKSFRCAFFVMILISLFAFVPSSFSTDWSPDMRLTWDQEWDSAPSTVYASDGKIWVFWHSYRTSNAEIFYKVYDPSQTHPWSPEMQLTNDTSTDGTPYAMQAADGSIWVVWMTNRVGNFEIFYKIYNGTFWSSETRLTFDNATDELPSILQTSDGKIWVFWDSLRTGNYDIFYKTTVNNGANWTAATQLTSHQAEEWDPSAIETVDGEIWLTYTRKDDIYYMTYNGTDWSSPTQLTTDSLDDWHPSILQDNASNIWVFWDSDRISYNGVPQTDIYYQLYNGTSWLPEDVQLTTDKDDDDMPSVIQDNNGTLWVFWSSNRVSNRDLFYRINATLPLHDVEIFSVIPLNSSIEWGDIAQIEVVVRNHGLSNETVEVECYANNTLIDTKIVWDLPPGELESIYFLLDSVDFSGGYYTLSATALSVPGETNVDDNTFVDGVLRIKWHDIAVLNVVPSKTIVGEGFTALINVTVQNQDSQTETFNLTVSYDGINISTQEVTLGVQETTHVVFTWNTTGVAKGNYTISATASPLPDEIDTIDNVYSDGYVAIVVPGDVNGDGTVEISDLTSLSQTYGFTQESSGWEPNYDINNDYVIDVFDLAVMGKNYGVTDP